MLYIGSVNLLGKPKSSFDFNGPTRRTGRPTLMMFEVSSQSGYRYRSYITMRNLQLFVRTKRQDRGYPNVGNSYLSYFKLCKISTLQSPAQSMNTNTVLFAASWVQLWRETIKLLSVILIESCRTGEPEYRVKVKSLSRCRRHELS